MKQKETWAGRGLSLCFSPETLASYWSSNTSCRKDESTGASRGQWPLQPPAHPQILQRPSLTSVFLSMSHFPPVQIITLLLLNSSSLTAKGQRFPFRPFVLSYSTVQYSSTAHDTSLHTSSPGLLSGRYWSGVQILYIPYLDFRGVRRGWEGAGRQKGKEREMLLSWFPVKASKVAKMEIGLLGLFEDQYVSRL